MNCAGLLLPSEARGQARLRKGLVGSGKVPRAFPQQDTQSGGLGMTGPLWSLLQKDRQDAKTPSAHNLVGQCGKVKKK